MTLPSKTSRNIAVDGRAYRWTTSQSFVGDSGFGVTLIVEAQGQKNPRIYDRPVFPTNVPAPWDSWYQTYQDDSPVLPRQVVAVIKFALSNGWDPSSNKDFESSILRGLILEDLQPELVNLLKGDKSVAE